LEFGTWNFASNRAERDMSTQTDLNVFRDWLGIPDAEIPPEGVPDHYALLRLVKFEDDPEKIRAHYRKLNTHVRGYASGQYGPQSQELLNELAKAMLCLTDPERKREYDESLGRVIEEKDVLGRMPMGQWLVRKKVISRDQLKEAESFAEARGLSLRDAVVQMKLVKPPVAAQALAQEMGLTYVDLTETTPDDSVLDKLPRTTVKHHSVMPLFVDEDVLLVACLDEPPHELEDELRLRYNVPCRWVLTTPLAMNQAIAKHYAPGARESAAEIDTVKKGGGKTTKKAAPKETYARLPEDEKYRRRQVGAMIIGWAAMIPLLLPTLLDLVGVRVPLGIGAQIAVALVLSAIAAVFTIVKTYLPPRGAALGFGAACIACIVAFLISQMWA
jgi:Type II secretion system (T2SS), protein E, N-terminal domain